MEQQTNTFGMADIKKGLRDIFRHSREYKGELVVILFLLIASSTIDAVGPYIWGKLIDSIYAKTIVHVGHLVVLESLALLALYIFLLLIQIFINLIQSLKSNLVEEHISTSYMARAYGHVFKLPMFFHKNNKSGETSEKIRAAAQGIENIFTNSILGSLPALMTAIIMYIIVFILNWQIGLVMTFALIGYIYYSIREIKPTVELQKQSRSAYKKANVITRDAMTNIKSLKDFNTEEREFDKIWSAYKDEAMKIWVDLFSIQMKTSTAQGYISMFVRAGVLAISIWFIYQGRLTVGQMLAYNTYALMIFSPLSNIINSWRNIQNGIVAVEDAETVLAMPTEAYVPVGSASEIGSGIVFDHVSFRYDIDKPVLSDISFSVAPGQTIALVGESGVGKSTLSELLSGYYFPTEGTITIGGIDIHKVNLNVLRQSIAVVSQEISLFNDTIEMNIRYGSFDAAFEKVEEAARLAHCLDFIQKFPEKWSQVVGERGLKLSVGQKQRVAIARAILKDPKILILDEPTSALDAGSEKIITDSLEVLMRGKTTFIIAHRLSTVRKADTF
jgi:ABC-type multidrug transport system fused ATPase/permease subunit